MEHAATDYALKSKMERLVVVEVTVKGTADAFMTDVLCRRVSLLLLLLLSLLQLWWLWRLPKIVIAGVYAGPG